MTCSFMENVFSVCDGDFPYVTALLAVEVNNDKNGPSLSKGVGVFAPSQMNKLSAEVCGLRGTRDAEPEHARRTLGKLERVRRAVPMMGGRVVGCWYRVVGVGISRK